MVVRIEQHFSLAARCFLICCCILASLDANEPDANRCRARESPRADEPAVESTRPRATIDERNSKAEASVAAKAVDGAVAQYSASNSENRGTSATVEKTTNRESQTAIYEKNDSIIYPTSIGDVNAPTSFTVVEESLIPTSEEIAHCLSNFVAGLSLCNATLHYPKSFVKNILRRHSILHSFANDLPSPRIKIHTFDIRYQADQEFKTLCASREFLHYPRMGKTASNGWKYIVQSDDNSQQFVQGIRVEVCVQANQKCDLVDNFPIGYDVQCVQKYTYRRLLAVSPNEKTATPDNFEFPSCCVCAYKSKGDGDLSFGTS